jgi:hypothetical protein
LVLRLRQITHLRILLKASTLTLNHKKSQILNKSL